MHTGSSPGLRHQVVVVWLLCLAGTGGAGADSVVPVPTSIRISAATLELVDPVSGTSAGGAGSDVRYAIGDVLTFRVAATSIPNAATRGLGGYLTVYVPDNCEVVGARFVDRDGNTVQPQRGGLAQDGVGPRGPRNYTLPLVDGSMSQLHADTGVFYSVDPRTARLPSTSLPTMTSGELLPVASTGSGQVDGYLGYTGSLYFAHNHWDWIQVNAFGTSGSAGSPPGGDVNPFGSGNTPFAYGSPVAGPSTFYLREATETVAALIEAAGTTGPWLRIRLTGSEMGAGAGTPGSGPLLRTGGPTASGSDLSSQSPLPQTTNAVRFALGELAATRESLVEVSLRVLSDPLDSALGLDAVCAEIFAGDSSAQAATAGGKDNPWRYFVPAPVCVNLGLRLENDVDSILSVAGSLLRYTIQARNLSLFSETNVVLTDTFNPGEVALVAVSGGGLATGGTITWPTIPVWSPGVEVSHTVDVTATATSVVTRNRATWASDQIPTPGYAVEAVTWLGALARTRLTLSVSPDSVPAGGSVRYTAVVASEGTGAVTTTSCSATPACQFGLKLPAGFTVVPATSTINGSGVPDPAFTGGTWIYTSGLPASIAAGAVATLEVDAVVAAATPSGLHSACLETWLRDPSLGRQFEDEACNLATVAVGAIQSQPPVLTGPVGTGARCIAGATSEADGSVARFFVDGTLRAITAAAGGSLGTCELPELYGGQRLTATVTAPGEFESDPSAALTVSAGEPPGEAVDLLASSAGASTVLTWTAPSTGGLPSAMTYDTLRAPAPHDFVGGVVCIESNDGPNTTASDATALSVGGAFFYLVRAGNIYGSGPLGTNSSAVLTPGRNCP